AGDAACARRRAGCATTAPTDRIGANPQGGHCPPAVDLLRRDEAAVGAHPVRELFVASHRAGWEEEHRAQGALLQGSAWLAVPPCLWRSLARAAGRLFRWARRARSTAAPAGRRLQRGAAGSAACARR